MSKNKSKTPALPPLQPRSYCAGADPVHEALALQVLNLEREIAGRDRRLAAQDATIKELRTAIRFAQNAAKLPIRGR